MISTLLKKSLLFLIPAVITVILLEGLVLFSFSNPSISIIPRDLLRYLHTRFDRNVIQVMPECARYDYEVTYTLRPGKCIFENREFSNEYRINSRGVRDSEEALKNPVIVVIGDSLTMGWGVNQQEAYPQRLRQLLKMDLLNTGISSFGTARELIFLKRIDLKKTKYLIIQYNANDFRENEHYAKDDLKILSESEYQKTVAAQEKMLDYVFGQYTFNILVQLQSEIRKRLSSNSSPIHESDRVSEAEIFLQVLKKSPVDLSIYNIIVISDDSGFVQTLKRLLETRKPLDWISAIHLEDFSELKNDPEMFYILDDHPTSLYHEVVAQKLSEVIMKMEKN